VKKSSIASNAILQASMPIRARVLPEIRRDYFRKRVDLVLAYIFEGGGAQNLYSSSMPKV
jgi:hypothetical protein